MIYNGVKVVRIVVNKCEIYQVFSCNNETDIFYFRISKNCEKF